MPTRNNPTAQKRKYSDQAAGDGTWEYSGSDVRVKSSATLSDKYDTGLWTKASSISYKLPLSAGSYTLTAGFHEWWSSGGRIMDQKVTDESGKEIATGDSVKVSASSRNASGAVSFTLSKAQTITYTVAQNASSSGEPVISWLTVSQQAQDLGSLGTVMGGVLPETVKIGESDVKVVWSDASKNYMAGKATSVGTFAVTGKTEDGAPITATVFNVPVNLTYFIDSGAADVSDVADYEAIKTLSPDLLNRSADQQWDGTASGKSWGWSGGGTGAGKISGSDTSNWLSTFILADYDSKGGQIVYHLTLPAGKYDIGAAQSPYNYPNGMYSTVTIGDKTIGARKVVSGLSDANNSVVQSVEVTEDSVVDVTVGTEGNAGYNVRLAGLWAARTGDVAAVDTTAPTFAGADDVEITVGDAFDPLAGVTATDDVDGDVTKSIKVSGAVDTSKAGEYTLTYRVSDKAGNEATATRTVTVEEEPVTPPAEDKTAPVFSGVSDVTVEFGASFDPLAGVSAKDDVDGDVTSSIKVEGDVDTSKAGTYTLTYTVSDKAGNTATATRVVTVKEKPVTPPAEDAFTVTFDANGGSVVDPVTVKYGEKVAAPAVPTRDGYTFAGWTSDKEGKQAYDFDAEVTADLTLYAQWTANESTTPTDKPADKSTVDTNATTKPDAKPGDGLAVTGSAVAALALLAVAMIAAGAALVRLARRS